MRLKTDRVMCRIVFHDAGIMTPTGRKDVADWLRKQADDLEKDGTQYSSRMTCRYIAVPGNQTMDENDVEAREKAAKELKANK